ncbi:XRE family transcriptional regulator [Rathayibacter sp. Leaf299]|uniref:helix-turn-helix transcriptional regulator n=1 Tax=unclassified Rathayibacter TaxID=2609250 RepID=UPI0006F54632|nr:MULTISPECIES: helix-turn-helix transcriptional regulator [unclassified Rathayibacter]KQQ21913.1 XRE family transcriptional regulator [Rathayibacter sp. Leaf299]
MDTRTEIRDFLISRRSRLTPVQAGLPDFGGRRRVPGLRREEVALLAGMSAEYYHRLEQGRVGGVSEDVLDGLCSALRLDDRDRSRLFELVRAANGGEQPRRRRSAPRPIGLRPPVQQLLDAMGDVPALVQNGRLDVVGANRLGAALFSEALDAPARNLCRFVFLDGRAPVFFRDWERIAQQCAALLRAEAGRRPFDRPLTDLVGELSTRSDCFRHLWASRDAGEHSAGPKRLHHPLVGDLDLDCEVLEITSDHGLLLVAYTASQGSRSAEDLRLLASWSAPASGPDAVDGGTGPAR